MKNPILIDHLFRHSYGKMVSILTRVFGLEHIQIIEDAVQDSFYKAIQIWKNTPPENPEAWLIKAARNRIIDIFRKLKADESRHLKVHSGPVTIAVQDIFLPHEIEDSQLRMIFTACHPSLSPEDQISFALKTLSGFSISEISAGLLTKSETIKKRLSRARKSIIDQKIDFKIPEKHELSTRIQRVHEVIYLLFNEGFHSTQQDQLIKKDLCFEAMRLCKILINRKLKHHETSCALLALMCFHMSRIDTKIDSQGDFITIQFQDRSKWDPSLQKLGNQYMNLAVQSDRYSSYHFEAAIAWEHLKAKEFENTDWKKIIFWYEKLYELLPSDSILLNMTAVYMQLNDMASAKNLLDRIDDKMLAQRLYLYHSTWAEYYQKLGLSAKCKAELEKAISLVKNQQEKSFLIKKLAES